MSANERQVGGNHYKRAQESGGEEHWDRVVSHELDYFQGQITSYVERCWEKLGIQDLEKAAHYIEKYIEVSRARGWKGRLEEHNEMFMAKLKMLAMQLETEDGVFTFPDGDSIETRRKQRIPVTAPEHKSTDRFEMIGIKENQVAYQCRACTSRFYVPIAMPPMYCPSCGAKPYAA